MAILGHPTKPPTRTHPAVIVPATKVTTTTGEDDPLSHKQETEQMGVVSHVSRGAVVISQDRVRAARFASPISSNMSCTPPRRNITMYSRSLGM